MKSSIRNRLLDLFFPRRCPGCDGVLTWGHEGICKQCQTQNKVFQKMKYPTCLKCGKQIGDERQEYCSDCEARSHLYIQGYPACTYESVRESVYHFKYSGRQEYADYYADIIYQRWGKELLQLGADGLIPVPIHDQRKKKRGYNQALLLARALSKRLGVPVYEDYVRRIKNTEALKNLTSYDRQNNLKNAFLIAPNVVKLKTTIIIDDIYTTGSTIDAVAGELKRAGVQKIYYASLAAGNIVS